MPLMKAKSLQSVLAQMAKAQPEGTGSREAKDLAKLDGVRIWNSWEWARELGSFFSVPCDIADGHN